MADFWIETDNTTEILAAKNEAVMKVMKAIGMQAEANAKKEITRKVYDQPPSPSGYKRTGRLRNSITHEYDGESVIVGTNVEYAPYVELGTSKMKARPFIEPAIADHVEEYQEMFRRVLSGSE